MSSPNHISTLLKRLRGQANLTQAQLGERLGVTKASISAYEKAKVFPSASVLTKLAREFNLSIDELLFASTDKSSSLRAAPLLPALHEVPYLSAQARPAFVEALTRNAQQARQQLACLLLPDLPVPVAWTEALVVEIDDCTLEPTLRPGARVLATPVPAADWPFMPSGLYCLAYRAAFVVKRLKDNTLLQNNVLLLHADSPTGGIYPVRGEDLRAVWQIRWAVLMPLA